MKKLKVYLLLLVIALFLSSCYTAKRYCPSYPPKGYDSEVKGK